MTGMDTETRIARATLAGFVAWMLEQDEDDLRAIGVEGSVEEPARLADAYAKARGWS